MSRPETVSHESNLTPIFAALSDETRLALVRRLSGGEPHSISELKAGLSLTRQGVTKHLRVLERAGLVTSRKSGRETRFVCAPEPIDRARAYLDAVSRQWDAAAARLKTFVES